MIPSGQTRAQAPQEAPLASMHLLSSTVGLKVLLPFPTRLMRAPSGQNVWHHFFKNGSQRWHKAASLLLPEKDYFRANERYDVQVTVAYNKNGRKEMRVSVGGYTLTYVDDLLPDTFLGGIIACEGRNYFYDFRMELAK